MKKNLKVISVVVASLIMAVAVTTLGYVFQKDRVSVFPADGYITEVETSEDGIQSSVPLNFAKDTKYKYKYPTSCIFKDVTGDKTVVEDDSFIHYSEGSISALTDGMIVNMDEAGIGFVDFYRLDRGMVMTKGPGSYYIDNNDSKIEFPEFIWQVSEDKLIAQSPAMTISLAGNSKEIVSGYAEIEWLDEEIVRIVTEDSVYQTITPGTAITFKSGAVLDLNEKEAYGKDGALKFTLDELMADLELGAIRLQSDSAENWQPPEFNFVVEDGKNGGVGDDGEIGTDGEAGKDGSKGSAGKQGDEGDPGDPGAGGSGGSAGGSGSGVNTQTLGIIRITSLNNDASNVRFTLTADNYDSFVPDKGTVEIREADTNRLIEAWTEQNFTTGATSFEYSCSKLTADKEYVIIVKNAYQLEVSGGINTGTKTFVKRNFFTSSDGFELDIAAKTENTLNIVLNKKPFSTVKACKLGITVEGHHVFYPDDRFLGESDFGSLNPIEIDLNEIFGNLDDDDRIATSNIGYTIDVYTSSELNDEIWNIEDDHLKGEENGKVRKSVRQVTGRTLKALPRFGTIDTSLSNEGYYDITANILEDKDNSVKRFLFKITHTTSGTVVKDFDVSTNKVKWYFGGALPAGEYRVDAIAIYNDNEKNNEVEYQPAIITSSATGSAAVTFKPYEIKNGYYVDSRNNKVAVAVNDHETAVNANRIWGDIVIKRNGLDIQSSSTARIVITSNDDSTYHREMNNVPVGNNVEGVHYIPIKALGLKANTTYSFTVYGFVNRPIDLGGSNVMNSINEECLGFASVRTTGIRGTELSDKTSIAAFNITSGVNDEENPDAVAKIELYQGKDIVNRVGNIDYKLNDVRLDSPYYFERSVARAIEFGIYQEKTLIGTVVKDLYSSSDILDRDTLQFDNAGQITDQEKKFYNGPLVTMRSDSIIVLTTDDFKKSGIDISSTKGIITIQANALYDYSYDLRKDVPLYEENFLDSKSINYNRMPLNVLELKSNTGTRRGFLNKAEINLGEKPPRLFEPADTAIEVTPIFNNINETGYTDSTLSRDTAIGLKAQAKYPNDNGDTISATYYGMTMDTYHRYKSAPLDGMDIIEAYASGRLKDELNLDIPIKITVDKEFFSDTGIPPLYVMITDDEELIGRCETRDPSGNIINIPDKTRQDRAVFYTDKISRGNSYVFIITLKSMYGVDKNDPNATAWEYPYDIGEKVPGKVYYGDEQRSGGTDILKARPRVAAYLERTENGDIGKNKAIWKYHIYDPDKALGNGPFKFYAGSKDNLLKRISYDLTNSDLLVSLLKTNAHEEALDEKAAKKAFGFNSAKDYKKEALHTYSVEVSDVPADAPIGEILPSFKATPYQVWMPMNLFTGKYHRRSGGTGIEFKNSYLEGGMITDPEYFAIDTVKHIYDNIAAEKMDKLKITVNLLPNTELLELVAEADDKEVTRHITGYIYEMYNSIGELKSWGIAPAISGMTESKVRIAMSDLNAGEEINVKVQAIYDTGVMGLNTLSMPSKINTPDGKNISLYAIQKQAERSYASSESYNTKTLVYNDTKAAGSMYTVKLSDNPERHNAVYNVRRYPKWVIPVDLEYKYTPEGAITNIDGNYPVFKKLAQTEAKLKAGTGVTAIEGMDNEVKLIVPPTKPSVVSLDAVAYNFHSTKFSVEFTEKSNQQIANTAIYDGKVYIELYEAILKDGQYVPADTPLDNTDNRYFKVQNEPKAVGKDDSLQDWQKYYTDVQLDAEGNTYFEAHSDYPRYRIKVDNLEKNKRYFVKMYCQPIGEGMEKQYVLDNYSAEKGNMFIYGFSTGKLLRIGKSGDFDSVELNANFKQSGYSEQELKVGYSLNRVEDFYLEYVIKDSDGEVVREFSSENVMKYMGYDEVKTEPFHYYDNGWKEFNRPVYYKKDVSGKLQPYMIRWTTEDILLLSEDNGGLNQLPSGQYTLEIQAYDLYGGEEMEYAARDGSQQNKAPSVNFVVPAAVLPNYRVNVTHNQIGRDVVARLTIMVSDPSYKIGVHNGNEVEMGRYRIKLKKGDWNQRPDLINYTEMQPSEYTINPLPGEGLLNKDVGYMITFNMKENVQYAIEVEGFIRDTSAIPIGDSIIYSSNRDLNVRNQLLITGTNKPQLGTSIAGKYDPESQLYSITTVGGINLGLVDSVEISITKISDTEFGSAFATIPLAFTTQGSMSKMTVPLKDLMESPGLNAKQDDFLAISFKFYGASTEAGQFTDNMIYEAPSTTFRERR